MTGEFKVEAGHRSLIISQRCWLNSLCIPSSGDHASDPIIIRNLQNFLVSIIQISRMQYHRSRFCKGLGSEKKIPGVVFFSEPRSGTYLVIRHITIYGDSRDMPGNISRLPLGSYGISASMVAYLCLVVYGDPRYTLYIGHTVINPRLLLHMDQVKWSRYQCSACSDTFPYLRSCYQFKPDKTYPFCLTASFLTLCDITSCLDLCCWGWLATEALST